MIPSTLLLALALNTCPDLTGRYRIDGEDGFVNVRIRQEACVRIHIDWTIY